MGNAMTKARKTVQKFPTDWWLNYPYRDELPEIYKSYDPETTWVDELVGRVEDIERKMFAISAQGPLTTKDYVANEAKRMRAEGKWRCPNDAAPKIAESMHDAAARSEVKRALSVGRIRNLLREMKL